MDPGSWCHLWNMFHCLIPTHKALQHITWTSVPRRFGCFCGQKSGTVWQQTCGRTIQQSVTTGVTPLNNNYYCSTEMESTELHEAIHSDLQFWTTRYNPIILHFIESVLYCNQYTPLFLLTERIHIAPAYVYATISLTN